MCPAAPPTYISDSSPRPPIEPGKLGYGSVNRPGAPTADRPPSRRPTLVDDLARERDRIDRMIRDLRRSRDALDEVDQAARDS